MRSLGLGQGNGYGGGWGRVLLALASFTELAVGGGGVWGGGQSGRGDEGERSGTGNILGY